MHQTSATKLASFVLPIRICLLGEFEMGDMLVVEKKWQPFIGDLVVLEKQDEFHIYEFAGVSGNEFVFMALDSKVENIKTTQWTSLPLVGTVTNTIHQMKPRRDLMKFAA